MKKPLGSIAREFVGTNLRRLNLAVVRLGSLRQLQSRQTTYDRIRAVFELCSSLSADERLRLMRLAADSTSQLGQDLFVAAQSDFKPKGFFVEMGACDGILGSNTYLLEKQLGWTGILAEPAKCWHRELRKARTARIETACVWSRSHLTLRFRETRSSMLSTVDVFSQADGHRETRRKGRFYDVNTISLIDLLNKYYAPKYIDYLSLDTEGSEFEILRDFDFGRYSFGVITCEHNFTPHREDIYRLLRKNGYERTWEAISGFEDWYFNARGAP